MRLLLCFVLLLALAEAQAPSTSPPAKPPSAGPPAPPPPPSQIPSLDGSALARLATSTVAPPPSPPYAVTPAGQREEGRGLLLQDELRKFLREQIELLQHGNTEARHRTLQEIALLAVETTLTDDALTRRVGSKRHSWLSAINPIAFRRACVAGARRSGRGDGSVVESIATLVDNHSEATRFLALQALEAIAADDPTTDVDNDHALAICATGVVPKVVELLSGRSGALRERAAATTAALVENAHCAKMFLGSGCMRQLVELAKYGTEAAQRHALSAVQMLVLERDAHDSLRRAGGPDILSGLAQYGAVGIRATAAEVQASLADTRAVATDARTRARLARRTRLGQSKLQLGAEASGLPMRRAMIPAHGNLDLEYRMESERDDGMMMPKQAA
jgi:hypothetical protein